MKKTFQLASFIAIIGAVTFIACKKKDDGPKYKEGWNSDSVNKQKAQCVLLLKSEEQCSCAIPKAAESMTYTEYQLTISKLVLQNNSATPSETSERAFIKIAGDCGVNLSSLAQ